MSSPTHWFYHKNDRGFGPLEEADIRGLLERNEIAANTLVWRDGLRDWTEAKNTELVSAAESAPPSKLDDQPSGVVSSESLSSAAIDDPEASFEEVVSGLPKIAAIIVRLPAANRTIALQATERSYYELALGWGYPDMRAKRWAAVVMVALHRAIEDQTQAFGAK
ncbi:MAG: hypothetical protein C5B58_08660 [Acidobacteria bacterium]|jgi:hypothetical protein|nr:MAG: hypothetical protein C5B58_08660 [Acidobacteriota bacterium]